MNADGFFRPIDAEFEAGELLRMARHHLATYSYVPDENLRAYGNSPAHVIYHLARFIEKHTEYYEPDFTRMVL